MKKNIFIPQKLGNLEFIEEFPNESLELIQYEVSSVIDEFKASVEEGLEHDIGFEQISWMGRGCFNKIGKNSYVIGKGTGPGIGSEEMRRFLDDLQYTWAQKEGKNGGCIRSDLGENWPYLVQYNLDENGNIVITDPRPEGFSIFGATYREALSGALYNDLGIDIVKPIRLYRENSETCWGGDKDSFRSELSNAVCSEISLWNKNIKSCIVKDDDYHNLDAGILFRHAKTPYRISNLLDACVDNDITQYNAIVESLFEGEDINKQNIDGVQTEIMKNLSKSAAIMFKNGIIHGQFNIHFQNITILGELSDFDSTIFLSLMGENTLTKKFDITLCNKVDEIKEKIKLGESKFGLDMYKFIEEDLGIFGGLDNDGGINQDVLFSNILGQIYDIFNQSMRVIDLLERYNGGNISGGMSQINNEKYEKLLNIFIENFKSFLTKEDLNYFSSILFDNENVFSDRYIGRDLGGVSIYGWKNRKKINYLKDELKETDVELINNEAQRIFNLIIS